jgi:hypothetical protein
MRVLLAALASILALASAAQAGGACTTEGYRKLGNGDRVPTPACQAGLIGRVARDHGIRVSDAQIRRHVEVRERICDTVGRDGRLAIACQLIDRY